jgi:hypothetical protein
VRCSLWFNFVNVRYRTLLLLITFFCRYALFDGVVDSRETMPSRGSSSSQSSDITPCVSQIHLNYEAMENQLRATQDVMMVEQEDHRATRDSLVAYNTYMQAFMTVRNKNTFIYFITFSDMYVC